MEQRKLPNATIALILSILSFILCCFTSGLGGVILAPIGLYLANKDRKLYLENPDQYDNYSIVKAARIIAIIGLVLSALLLVTAIGLLIYAGSSEDLRHMLEELLRQAAEQQ